MERHRTSWRRTSTAFYVVALLGCHGGAREASVRQGEASASVTGSTRAVPPAVASSPTPDAPLFEVDETGPSVRGKRIDVSGVDAEKTIDPIVVQNSPGHGVVPVRVSRGASIQWVGVFVRALGRTGVEEVDIVTPSARGGAPVPLKLSPLGQVPMQEARCGARVVVQSDGASELQYLGKAKASLPEGSGAPEVSRALTEMSARMKSCESTVWMLAGDKAAKWGPAFDVGSAVSASELAKGTTRYVMLL